MSNEKPKIVGGNVAAEGQFPYQASLRYRGRHFCGGSIINERWILTASHCLSGYVRHYRSITNKKLLCFHAISFNSFNDTAIGVVLGTNTLDKGGDEYASIRIWAHPYYNAVFIWNDIGLIQLDKDIVFSDKVKPIALSTKNFDKSDYPATLSGWGTTSVSI